MAVGVAWFQRVCMALDAESRATEFYRSHVSSCAPDSLKGPFHHAARKEVGLERDMYDVERWPESVLKGMMLSPAEAAYLRGHGGIKREQRDRSEEAVVVCGLVEGAEDLSQLRGRLALLLELDGLVA